MSNLSERVQGWAGRIADAAANVASKGGEAAQTAAKAIAERRELAARGVTQEDHKLAASYLARGREYYNKKRYDRAVECFSEACDCDPGYALAHYFHGAALYKSKEVDSAVRAWKRAQEIDPDSEIGQKAARRLGSIKGKMQGVIDKLQGSHRFQ